MRLLLIPFIFLALLGCNQAAQPPGKEAAPGAQAGPVKGVDRSHKGTAAPAATFNDPDGNETSLAEFSGKPLLLNLWATWCAPCVKELPTLDRLAADDKGVAVIAVSQDSGPHASVEAFLANHKIVNLAAYQDAKSGLSGALGPDAVLPTTILYDSNGREVWRYVGDLDWTGPEAARKIAEGAAPPQKG
ncbi:MAG: TlpA disulfide reductase family protein [Sphingomicrobium sp.]